jgi:hypothetical protein
MIKCVICKGLVDVLSKGTDFDEFKSGGLRGKYAVAIWNFEAVLGYDLRQRNITSKEKQFIMTDVNERESRTLVNKQVIMRDVNGRESRTLVNKQTNNVRDKAEYRRRIVI